MNKKLFIDMRHDPREHEISDDAPIIIEMH